MEYALNFDNNKTSLLLKDLAANEEIIEYLLGLSAGTANLLTKLLKPLLNIENVFFLQSTYPKVKNMIQTAVREWLNER